MRPVGSRRPTRRGQWVFRTSGPAPASFKRDKPLIDAACHRFIDEVLKPRFMQEIRPTQFNYPIDICGRWHGTNFRFIQRYRVRPPNPDEEEFDAPFARLEYCSTDRFGLSYFRHTEEWWPLCREVSLAKALTLMQENELLWPS
jgi:hypothetical protein